MSVPYHLELFNRGNKRLILNYSGIKDNTAGEDLKLHIYMVDENGIPLFSEKLTLEETRILYEHLNAISIIKEKTTKSSKFIETTEEINLLIQRLNDSDLETITLILQKFESNDKIKALLSSLDELEIENLHGAFHHKYMIKEIQNLEKLIDWEINSNILNDIESDSDLSKYKAGQPEKIFQNWIESNLWIFGVDYIRKHDARKISIFSEGDILMESVDGFLDLIELKRPKHSLLKHDPSHNCYYPHNDLSIVIGQSLFYLQKLTEYKSNLENEYKINVLMPRIKIIIGNDASFDEERHKCLRMINSDLKSIQIITYNDLIKYGYLLIQAYEKYNTFSNR